MQTYNILLIGDEDVGKETMIKTYIFSKQEVDSVKSFKVDIWHIVYLFVENQMQEMQLAFTHTNVPTEDGKGDFLRNTNAFILVYSSVSAESFENLKKFVNDTFKNAKSVCNVPLVLVATKGDLPNREVDVGQGLAQAESWGVPFMEISATNKDQLNVLFLRVVENINLARRSLLTSQAQLFGKLNIKCCTLL